MATPSSPAETENVVDAFVQSVNNLGLHHQFLARGVTTVEDTLVEGEAYLLANQMHRNRGASHQVEVGPLAARDNTDMRLPPTTAMGQLTTALKVAQLTNMLAKLLAALTPKPPEDTAYELPRPFVRPPGETTNFCWECGNPEHFRRYCPLLSQGLNDHSLQMFPPAMSRR